MMHMDAPLERNLKFNFQGAELIFDFIDMSLFSSNYVI